MFWLVVAALYYGPLAIGAVKINPDGNLLESKIELIAHAKLWKSANNIMTSRFGFPFGREGIEKTRSAFSHSIEVVGLGIGLLSCLRIAKQLIQGEREWVSEISVGGTIGVISGLRNSVKIDT